MRRVPALLVAAGLVIATLSGCTSANVSCVVHAGDASDLVSVSGKFGTKQKVNFPTPLDTDSLQRSTLIDGKGTGLQQGQLIKAQLNLLDGKTGESEQNSKIGLALNASTYPGLAKALQCVTVGSRVAITGTAKQIFGTSGLKSTGLPASYPLVFVIDVTKAFLPRANGTPQPGQPGFPKVVLAPNGRPGITVPTTPAPESVKTETLRKGHGATVKKSDTVIVNYTQVSWSDNSVLGSSWQDGSAVAWTLGTPQSPNQGTAIAPAGTQKALTGSRVGSQLVVLVPEDKSSGNPASAYVIDVLGIS